MNMSGVQTGNARLRQWALWAGRIVSLAPVLIVLMSARWKLTFDPWYVQEWARIGWQNVALPRLAILQLELQIGDRTPEGGGIVSGPPWHLEGRSLVDGVERRVSPVCPHLGGIVNWNDSDETWECPLHGSRFAPDGKLLEGPATRDLTAAQ